MENLKKYVQYEVMGILTRIRHAYNPERFKDIIVGWYTLNTNRVFLVSVAQISLIVLYFIFDFLFTNPRNANDTLFLVMDQLERVISLLVFLAGLKVYSLGVKNSRNISGIRSIEVERINSHDHAVEVASKYVQNKTNIEWTRQWRHNPIEGSDNSIIGVRTNVFKDIKVGPIRNHVHACTLAKDYIEKNPHMEWSGQWYTTVPGEMSVIGVRERYTTLVQDEMVRDENGIIWFVVPVEKLAIQNKRNSLTKLFRSQSEKKRKKDNVMVRIDEGRMYAST